MTYHSSLPQTPGNHCSILCFYAFDYVIYMGLPQWLSGKESACNAGAAGDMALIPGLGKSPGGGLGNLLQYSCLENPMDRGAWRATVHRIAKNQT